MFFIPSKFWFEEILGQKMKWSIWRNSLSFREQFFVKCIYFISWVFGVNFKKKRILSNIFHSPCLGPPLFWLPIIEDGPILRYLVVTTEGIRLELFDFTKKLISKWIFALIRLSVSCMSSCMVGVMQLKGILSNFFLISRKNECRTKILHLFKFLILFKENFVKLTK